MAVIKKLHIYKVLLFIKQYGKMFILILKNTINKIISYIIYTQI